ncbi:MAG: hypothetical protein GX667_07640 [Xanthomonadaceae bacterium]|nr:hypothetical protein [Xanthomonadaceae bacterium]
MKHPFTILRDQSRLFRTLIAFLVLICASFATAQTDTAQPQTVPNEVEELNQIKTNLDDVIAKKEAIKKELAKADDAEQKESLTYTLDQLTLQKKNFETMFEKKALGGLDIDRFENFTTQESQDPETYDWQKELIQIIQPVFSSLQDLTESQRKKDGVRANKNTLEESVAMIDKGIKHLDKIDKTALSPASQESLEKIRASWEIKKANFQNQLDLVMLEYQEIEKEGTFIERMIDGTINFLTNRGLILLLSFGAFFGLLYLFSWILNRLTVYHEKKYKHRKTSFAWRLTLLLYQIATFAISFTALLVILHSSGDMVLFGFAILILFAFLISFRNSIPAYFKKIRTFLNMGLAREGERLIYQGIPWRIENINLYSVYLVNPALDNGKLRLNVDLLDGMLSRPVKMDEIWFPCRPGDTVIIDGTYAKVVRQTPESVYLDSFGSTINYPTANFIAAKPKNLTYGYSITINFTLSHDHFDLDIEETIEKIRESVEAHTINVDEGMKKAINAITVDFREIDSASGLVYTVIASMGVNALNYYYSLPRLMQRACVKAAQKHHWTIPYSEVVISERDQTPKPLELAKAAQHAGKMGPKED